MVFTSKLTCLTLMIPGLAMANIAVDSCTATDICTYSINATGLNVGNNPPTEDVNSTWNVTFSVVGPVMQQNVPEPLVSFVVSGTPAPGWVYAPQLYPVGGGGYGAEVNVTFLDENFNDGLGINDVTYTFFGSSEFWATAGGPFAFGATDDPFANSGAFSTFDPGFDPVCTECTVTTTVTPEPGSLGLLAAVIGVCLLPFRKKLSTRGV